MIKHDEASELTELDMLVVAVEEDVETLYRS
jgi:hypothetical protein